MSLAVFLAGWLLAGCAPQSGQAPQSASPGFNPGAAARDQSKPGREVTPEEIAASDNMLEEFRSELAASEAAGQPTARLRGMLDEFRAGPTFRHRAKAPLVVNALFEFDALTEQDGRHILEQLRDQAPDDSEKEFFERSLEGFTKTVERERDA